MNVLELSAKEILNITKPEVIFNKDNIKELKRKLSSKWHPDKHHGAKEANEVLAHINLLIEQAEIKFKNGSWEGAYSFEFSVNSKKYKFSSIISKSFELGKVHIGKKHIIYVIDDINKDLAENAIKNLLTISYASDTMKAEFERQLPNLVTYGKSEIGYVVVMKKSANAIFLSDLIAYLGGNIDPKHVAWIGSRLFNIITFLDYIGLCHNGISADTVLINPSKHACYLIGGWWYSAKKDTKINAIPNNLSSLYPNEVFLNKIAKTKYDKVLVKALLIECLGDSSKSGSKLLVNSNIPKPMLNWLRTIDDTNIKKDFSKWYKILNECFGARKFVDMSVDINLIY